MQKLTKKTEKIKREPLIHIAKRDNLSFGKKAVIYAISLISGLLLSSIVCSVFSEVGTVTDFFRAVFKGAFGTPRKIWDLFRSTALLLGVSLALVPAFKMKFWNLGGKLPDNVVIVFMIISSIAAGAIWAVIPAIFKALFNTNESLFTLMMNYIAQGIVMVCVNAWVKGGSGIITPIKYANIPNLVNEYLLIIIVFAVLCLFMFAYLKYSKHGYEIAVVGESQNTAKYIGINVKKVIIRTLLLSGAICGIVGLFISGAMSHSVNTSSANNMGFTGIMTAWLANFNPLMIALSSLFISFISKGMVQVRKDFAFTNDSIANLVIGLVYFCVIACYFFITYKIVFRKRNSAEKEDKK